MLHAGENITGRLAKIITFLVFFIMLAVFLAYVYSFTDPVGQFRMTGSPHPGDKINIYGINVTQNTVYAANWGEVNVTITSFGIELPKTGTEVWQENVYYPMEMGGATKTIILNKDLMTLPTGKYFFTLTSSNDRIFYCAFTIPQEPFIVD